jgi:molybdate transport system ATP-binding protein
MSTLRLKIRLTRPGFILDVDHELPLHGVTAIFGPSGSGKTTLLRVIAGLERDARGAVEFDGEPWQSASGHLPAHRRRIGYVFQDGRLFPHLTVEQNLRFGQQRKGREPAVPGGLGFDATVDALGLEGLLPRRTPSLSGGEQQRVAIARALLTNPRLLLMDEPLSSLDAGRKREILPHLDKLAAFKVPVLYVTHNVDEVARLANDVALLNAGRITAHGPVTEIFERLDLQPFTGGIEAGTVLHARVLDHRDGSARLGVGAQELRVPMAAAAPGAFRRVRIHARDVAIATVRPEKLSIRNVLIARILQIEAGSNLNVELLLDVDGERIRSRITRDALDELELAVGQQVFALIKSVALESSLSS